MAAYYTKRKWPTSSVSQTPLYLETQSLTSTVPTNFSSPRFAEISWENTAFPNTSPITSRNISHGDQQYSASNLFPISSVFNEANDIDLLIQASQIKSFEYSPSCSGYSSCSGGVEWTQDILKDNKFPAQYPRQDGHLAFHNLDTGLSLARPKPSFPTDHIVANMVDCQMPLRSNKQLESKPQTLIKKRNDELIYQNTSNKLIKLIPSNTVYLPRPAKMCDFKGCGRKFGREEHLKRHKKIHLKTETFTCPFCGKSCSRFDNLQAHIKRHDKGDPNRPNRRTKYFEEAALIIEQMSKKRRKEPFRKK